MTTTVRPSAGTAAIRPFTVQVPERDLDDLRRRIAAVRLPGRELVTDRSQGVQLATIQELARHWATGYDWRACEARLNALPQFVTEIDGVDIHFIHVPPAARRRIGVADYTGRDAEGGPLRIRVLGRDAQDTQRLARRWRALAYRDPPRRGAVGRLEQVEHEALATLLARQAGGRRRRGRHGRPRRGRRRGARRPPTRSRPRGGPPGRAGGRPHAARALGRRRPAPRRGRRPRTPARGERDPRRRRTAAHRLLGGDAQRPEVRARHRHRRAPRLDGGARRTGPRAAHGHRRRGGPRHPRGGALPAGRRGHAPHPRARTRPEGGGR